MRKITMMLALAASLGMVLLPAVAVDVDPARKQTVVEQTLKALDISDPTVVDRAALANALVEIHFEADTSDRVILSTETEPRVSVMTLEGEGKLILDFFDTVNLLEERTVTAPGLSTARRARSSQFEVLTDLTTRVVLDLKEMVEYTQDVTDEGLVITFESGDATLIVDAAVDEEASTIDLEPLELKPVADEEGGAGETLEEETLTLEGADETVSETESLLTEETTTSSEELLSESTDVVSEVTPEVSEETELVTDEVTGTTAADLLADDGSGALPDELMGMSGPEEVEPAEKIVTISFAKGTSLVEAVNALARVGELNVVIDPAVSGDITARLVNVPLKVALRSLLIVNGYDYIEKENVYRIVPIEKTGMQDVETKMLIRKLDYVDADGVEDTVKDFITKEYGKLSIDEASNTLVVSDIPPKIEDIELLVDSIDTRTKQVFVEAAIIDVRVEEGTAFGFNWFGPSVNYGDWGVPGYYSGATSPSGMFTSGQTLSNATGSTSLGSTESLLKYTGPGGNLLSVPDTDTLRALFTGIDPVTGALRGVAGGWAPAVLETGSTLTSNFQILTDQFGIEGLIQAADDSMDVEVLAMPTILTMDNQPATVSVIERLPYVEYRYDKDTGVITDVTYKTEDVKILLEVTPHITTDNQILMAVRIHKDEGEFEEFSIFGGVQTQFPNVTERFVETKSIIVDGNTLVMGGLRDTRESKNVNQIPFLGRLPLIGWLFRGEEVRSRDFELVVFLTPHILDSDHMITERDRDLYETTITHADNATVDPYNRLGPYYDQVHRSEYASPHGLKTVPGAKKLKTEGWAQWKYW